jgi:hypothetical protein
MAAISYARSPRDSDVIALADRLNRDGVDCEIDVYDSPPAEGWARWMEHVMTRRTVLVIASEAYYRRYHRQEPPGIGLGATFETGLLAQRVLEMQGKNEGVIPILLSSDDSQFIPEFLKDVERYDLSDPAGYEHLYRRLTGQPEYAKPPLGEVRVLPPKNEAEASTTSLSSNSDAVRFYSDDGFFGIRMLQIERARNLRITLLPDDENDIARLRALHRLQRFGVAYGSSATFARVKDSRELVGARTQRYELDLIEEPVDNSFGSEMSLNGISADEIAEMRARRILLNEKLPASGNGDWGARLNDMTMDSFVAGSIAGGNRLSVKASPIPLLAKAAPNSSDFVTAARLACVMLLVLTGTIEHVTRLEIKLVNEGAEIHFEGIRHRVYSNCEPSRIVVEGICPIDRAV